MKILSTVRAQLKCSTSRIPCVSCSPSPILEFPSPQLEVDPYLVKHNFHVRALSPLPKIHQNILGTALYHLVCSLKRKMLGLVADIRSQLWDWGLGTSLLKEDPSGSLGTLASTSLLFPSFDVLPKSSLGKTSRHSGDLRVSCLVRCFLHCLTSSWNSPSEKYPGPEPTRTKRRDKVTDAISTGTKESPV